MSQLRGLEQLRFILGRISAGDDDELTEIVQARDEVIGRYQPLFSDEHLPSLTKEEFRSFLRYENNRHWRGISRHLGALTEDMEAFRVSLLVLLDESRPLRERLDELRPTSGKAPVRGLGPATLTPILLVRYPEKYGVLNRIVAEGLKSLDMWPVVPASAGFSELYVQVNERLLEYAAELSIDLWTLDALWWRVADLDATRTTTISMEYWWVNQGDSYKQERQGGYVWAPQRMRDGRTAGHHANVRRVSRGDIVIHYAKGAIRALGVAEEDGREGGRPAELQANRSETEGYFAPIQYWELEEPIELDELPIGLRDGVEGGPFNVEGRVNQGYLFPLSEEVAERIRNLFPTRWPEESGWKGARVDTYLPTDAHQDLFIPPTQFDRLLTSIKSRKNLILQGPPGTGKTFIARRIAWCLIGHKDDDPIEMVQFHQSYAYEDFVQGFRPTDDGGFTLMDGVFHRFCERARANPETPHVFIIDEINRGNLSRIFGELLMLIEHDKRSKDYAVSLTYSDTRFHVPENVHILGMMNTADRSLALVDYALRRRFAFETLEPAYGTDYGRSAFEKYLTKTGADSGLARRICERIGQLNAMIRADRELGRGFQVGHSYFVPDKGDEPSGDWYRHIVDTQIAPLLREYWFDSPEIVEEAVAGLTGDA